MEKTTTLKYTPDNYRELLEAKSVFKGYTYLCRYFGIVAQKSQSNGQKAHFNEWERLFEIVKTGNKKEIKITNVYESPLPDSIKRSIYAEYIKTLVLTWLSNSEDGKVIFTNRSKLETLGLVNKNYFDIARLEGGAITRFLSDNKINQATFYDFLTKNKDNFRDRIEVVLKNLIKNGLIYTPKQLYAVRYKNFTKHEYLKEDSIEHSIIAKSIQFTLKKYFNDTDYNSIRFNKAKLKKFDEKVLKLINALFKRVEKPEINFYYVVTEIQVINKELLVGAFRSDDAKKILVTLNEIVSENIINSAIAENTKEVNVICAEKLKEYDKLKEDDYDAYYDLCEQCYWDSLDKYGFFATPETKYFFKGYKASLAYVEDIKKLVRMMIVKSSYEIEENELLHF